MHVNMKKNNVTFGIDEVGRGPLAGPVVAACVTIICPKAARKHFWREVTDSKKLTRDKRETLYDLICGHSVFGIAEASAAEIDRLNIHHATLLAMKRAYLKCRERHGAPACRETMQALVDGKFCPDIDVPARAVIGGDALHLQMAAASIIAKVHRDRLMTALAADHPHYGWHSNVGYSTAAHLAAIRDHGITPHHRKSFAPCRQGDLLADCA